MYITAASLFAVFVLSICVTYSLGYSVISFNFAIVQQQCDLHVVIQRMTWKIDDGMFSVAVCVHVPRAWNQPSNDLKRTRSIAFSKNKDKIKIFENVCYLPRRQPGNVISRTCLLLHEYTVARHSWIFLGLS